MASTVLIKRAGPKPFSKKASAATPGGRQVPENAPLIAIRWTAGSWSRTTERNSKLDMPGMLRSEMMMSGISCRISDSAEKPSAADLTQYPSVEKICERELRIETSSSTMRSFTLASGIVTFRKNQLQDSTKHPAHLQSRRVIVLTHAAFWSTGQEQLVGPEEYGLLGNRAQAIGRAGRH